MKTTLTDEPRSANVKHVPLSGTVRTNGQELFYEIHGDGPPLVLVMGIGYDSSLWTLQQVPALSTRFRVVLLDNRDTGRSSRAGHPYAIADMADDVAGLLDELDIDRTHLVGLSMGSMIGMEFALQHADRLDRLVLAGPGAAPARSAVDPISVWNWVKANDPSGAVFGGQQFTWLFSSAFLRNHRRCGRPAPCWRAIRTRWTRKPTTARLGPIWTSTPSIGSAASRPAPW